MEYPYDQQLFQQFEQNFPTTYPQQKDYIIFRRCFHTVTIKVANF